MSYTKILFFILNSLSWLVPGVLIFSMGVGMGVLTGMQYGAAGVICTGLGMMVVASQGYSGAVSGNKKTFNPYMAMTVLLSVAEIICLSVMCEAKPGLSIGELGPYALGYGFVISHTVIMLMTALVGCGVAVQARLAEEQAASKPAGFF